MTLVIVTEDISRIGALDVDPRVKMFKIPEAVVEVKSTTERFLRSKYLDSNKPETTVIGIPTVSIVLVVVDDVELVETVATMLEKRLQMMVNARFIA